MEFEIGCPIDGSVQVGLEDIDNVVLKEHSRADITFICPHCGSEISVTAVVPQFLLSAIEALSSSQEPNVWSGVFVMSAAETDDDSGASATLGEPVAAATISGVQESTLDAYCEYFRRQLAEVSTADDIIEQIDAGRS